MVIIKQKDVVPIIAKVLFPYGPRKNPHNCIRQQISRAIEKGDLKTFEKQKGNFEHDAFWRWAREKWQELQYAEEIPVVSKAPIIGKSNTQTPSFSMSASGYSLPANPNDYEKELVKANQTINTLRAKIVLLEDELTPFREAKEKADAFIEICTIKGGEGGRGNSK